MWNSRLNEKLTNRLIGYCQNKRVLILGNSVSLLNEPRGDFIDSFDVVVRLGKGIPFPELKDYLGQKTDVWALSVLRADLYKYFVDTPYKVLNIAQISVYDTKKKTTSISKVFYNNDFELYKDYFLMGDLAGTRRLIKSAYGKVDENERVSQGAMTLAYFVNIIRSYKELHIYGFDFFEGKITYELDGQVNEVSSFHLPIPIHKGTNSNPHAGLYVAGHPDKDYILKLRDENKIILHEMSPLKDNEETKQKIQTIVDIFRKEAKLLGIETSTSTQKDGEDTPGE